MAKNVSPLAGTFFCIVCGEGVEKSFDVVSIWLVTSAITKHRGDLSPKNSIRFSVHPKCANNLDNVQLGTETIDVKSMVKDTSRRRNSIKACDPHSKLSADNDPHSIPDNGIK